MATYTQYAPPQWVHQVPGPSAPTELPFTIPVTLPSQVQSDTASTSRVKTSHPTSRELHNEVDVGPGIEPTPEESVSPEAPTKPSKKNRDMLRKRDQRADDRKQFKRICELLDISLSPKKTLANRSEYPCIHVSISLKVSCVS